MPHSCFDRSALQFYPLSERDNREHIESIAIKPTDAPPSLTDGLQETIGRVSDKMREARTNDRPVMLAFGAHAIKNGLAPVLINLMEEGWVTHLATNGAGIIHDWEFSFLGETSEHVERNVKDGRFGMWEETGRYLNLAILLGAYRGLGYGESVGKMIQQESLDVPGRKVLQTEIRDGLCEDTKSDQIAAAADVLHVLGTTDLCSGHLDIPHPYKKYSAQAAAWRMDIPFTSHPMFGHDIIYLHPYNYGPAIGRAAQRDYLTYAEGVSRLNGGVYISVGSAVMSPMIFEKSMSMAQNLSQQNGGRMQDHFVVVNDIQESTWDWSEGEPPEEHPDYYLRFYKTFHRMGGELRYAQCDNRHFLLNLCHELGT